MVHEDTSMQALKMKITVQIYIQTLILFEWLNLLL